MPSTTPNASESRASDSAAVSRAAVRGSSQPPGCSIPMRVRDRPQAPKGREDRVDEVRRAFGEPRSRRRPVVARSGLRIRVHLGEPAAVRGASRLQHREDEHRLAAEWHDQRLVPEDGLAVHPGEVVDVVRAEEQQDVQAAGRHAGLDRPDPLAVFPDVERKLERNRHGTPFSLLRDRDRRQDPIIDGWASGRDDG